jgi:hypothetical protein
MLIGMPKHFRRKEEGRGAALGHALRVRFKNMHTRFYKNIILIAVFALLIGNWSAAAVFAAKPISITVSSVYGERRGAVLPVGIFITNALGMSSGVLELTFDPKVAQLITATRGELLDGFLFAENINSAKTGIIKFAWAAENAVDQDGKLLDLSFKYLTAGGNTDLRLTEAGLYNLQGNNILTNAIDGSISKFKGRQMQPPEPNVSPLRKWNIRFNQPVDPGTVNKHTIYVINDDSGEIVDTTVAIGENGNIVTVSPKNSYSPGNYTLVIPQQVKAANGESLKEGLKMPFTVT